MRWWIGWITALLAYTALITPFEVAYVPHDAPAGMMFANFVVDSCFMLDVVINFNLAYFDAKKETWILNLNKIRRNYLNGWFIVDFTSALPWDLIAESIESHSKTRTAFLELRITRIFKLMRLLKLLRILRAGRLLQVLENAHEVDYNLLRLSKLMIGFLVFVHWENCAWRILAPDNLESEESWLSSVYENEAVMVSRFELYITGSQLLWQGNLEPVTLYERIMMLGSLFLHSIVYAYLFGEVVNLVVCLNRERAELNKTIVELNTFMRKRKVSPHLRTRLREFYRYHHASESVGESQGKQWRMLSVLSPALRNEVGEEIAGWIFEVPLFKGLEKHHRELLVEIALHMPTVAVAPHELVYRKGDPCDKLFVVERGVVISRGRVMIPGPFKNKEGKEVQGKELWPLFGDEGFLSAIRPGKFNSRHQVQKRTYVAVSLTFCVLITIDKDQLLPLLRKHRGSLRTLRKNLVRFVARRTFGNLVDSMQRLKAKLHVDDSSVGKQRQPRSSFSCFDSEYIKIDYQVWILKLDDERVKKAALSIQRAFRGFLVRKKYNINLREIKKRVRAKKSSRAASAYTLTASSNARRLEPIVNDVKGSSTAMASPQDAVTARVADNMPTMEEQVLNMTKLLTALKRDVSDVKAKLEDLEDGFVPTA